MKKIKEYLYVLPVSLYIIFILAEGFLVGLLGSFGYFKSLGQEEFTLRYYYEVLTSKDFMNSWLFTLSYTLISTILAIIFGFIIALALRRVKGNAFIENLLKIPIIIPYITVSLYVILIFSDQGGLAKVINFFSPSLYNSYKALMLNHGGIKIILAFIWKSTPYVAVSAYGILRRLSGRYESCARNLGANGFKAFFTITLPLMKETLFTLFAILFSFIISTYEIPKILGATYPKSLSTMSMEEFLNPLMEGRSTSMVYSMVQIISSILLVLLVQLIIYGGDKKDGK